MKLYYYTFTPDGEVLKDIITARKNKHTFAISPYTTYGGREYMCATKLNREQENQIRGAASTASDGCYMYSTTISEITDKMRDFAKKREEYVNKIIELEDRLHFLAKNFNSVKTDKI